MAVDPKTVALYKDAIVKIDAAGKARKATEPKFDILEASQKSFDEMFKDSKKLQNDVQTALSSAEDVATLARRSLERLQKRADDDREALKKLFAKSEVLAQKADDAKETHKKPLLAAAQKAYDGLLVEPALFLHGKLMEDLMAFVVEAGLPKYGPELQAELKNGIKDIQIQMAGVRVYAEQLGETSKRVGELNVDEIDMKQMARKGAKLLALDREGEDAMAQAFKATFLSGDLAAALDKIGAKAEPKQKGRDMLTKLQKMKIVTWH